MTSGEDTLNRELIDEDTMVLRYKNAVERAISHLPVKNGAVDIDSIWVETSLPFELLRSLLRRKDLKLPENVERINLKSRAEQGDRSGSRKRR
jgi:hypothetical protein